LPPDITQTLVVIACEDFRRDFPAQITIDAGEVVVIVARNIVGIFVSSVCHILIGSLRCVVIFQ
jgi:hypothetical protein